MKKKWFLIFFILVSKSSIAHLFHEQTMDMFDSVIKNHQEGNVAFSSVALFQVLNSLWFCSYDETKESLDVFFKGKSFELDREVDLLHIMPFSNSLKLDEICIRSLLGCNVRIMPFNAFDMHKKMALVAKVDRMCSDCVDIYDEQSVITREDVNLFDDYTLSFFSVVNFKGNWKCASTVECGYEDFSTDRSSMARVKFTQFKMKTKYVQVGQHQAVLLPLSQQAVNHGARHGKSLTAKLFHGHATDIDESPFMIAVLSASGVEMSRIELSEIILSLLNEKTERAVSIKMPIFRRVISHVDCQPIMQDLNLDLLLRKCYLKAAIELSHLPHKIQKAVTGIVNEKKEQVIKQLSDYELMMTGLPVKDKAKIRNVIKKSRSVFSSLYTDNLIRLEGLSAETKEVLMSAHPAIKGMRQSLAISMGDSVINSNHSQSKNRRGRGSDKQSEELQTTVELVLNRCFYYFMCDYTGEIMIFGRMANPEEIGIKSLPQRGSSVSKRNSLRSSFSSKR